MTLAMKRRVMAIQWTWERKYVQDMKERSRLNNDGKIDWWEDCSMMITIEELG